MPEKPDSLCVSPWSALWYDGWSMPYKNKLDGILSYYLWFLDLPTEFLINIWIIYSNLQRHFNSAYGRGKRMKNIFVSLWRGQWPMTRMIACLICNYSLYKSSFSGRNFLALGPSDYGGMRVIGFSLTRGQAVQCTKFEMDLSEMNSESDNGYCPLIAFKIVSGRDKYLGFAFSPQ